MSRVFTDLIEYSPVVLLRTCIQDAVLGEPIVCNTTQNITRDNMEVTTRLLQEFACAETRQWVEGNTSEYWRLFAFFDEMAPVFTVSLYCSGT